MLSIPHFVQSSWYYIFVIKNNFEYYLDYLLLCSLQLVSHFCKKKKKQSSVLFELFLALLLHFCHKQTSFWCHVDNSLFLWIQLLLHFLDKETNFQCHVDHFFILPNPAAIRLFQQRNQILVLYWKITNFFQSTCYYIFAIK